MGGGGAVVARIVDSISEGDVSLGFRFGVDVGFFEGKRESRDMRSAGSMSLADSDSDPGTAPPEVVRLESLLQNDSLVASVLAIGELARESIELGVEVPESGVFGEE